MSLDAPHGSGPARAAARTNLRSVDLNLLVILDVLLDEVHVSRAAVRLALSQPATSAALSRLRHLFDDPLLERSEGAMRLTPVAESLRGRLKDLLGGAEALLDLQPQGVDQIRQTVRIATADHIAALIAVQLHARLVETAPGLDLIFQPYHGADAALDGLAKGAIDLAISPLPGAGPPFHRDELMRERWKVLMRKGHPAARTFSLDAWLAYPHVSVSGTGDIRVGLDDRLADLGRTRRVAMVVPSFLMVTPMVLESDLVTILPSRCLALARDGDFAAFDPPIPMDEFPIHIAWHARRAGDVAVQHVRATIEAMKL
jgi:DNA-binding transcriptional LysR family regulator